MATGIATCLQPQQSRSCRNQPGRVCKVQSGSKLLYRVDTGQHCYSPASYTAASRATCSICWSILQSFSVAPNYAYENREWESESLHSVCEVSCHRWHHNVLLCGYTHEWARGSGSPKHGMPGSRNPCGSTDPASLSADGSYQRSLSAMHFSCGLCGWRIWS